VCDEDELGSMDSEQVKVRV